MQLLVSNFVVFETVCFWIILILVFSFKNNNGKKMMSDSDQVTRYFIDIFLAQ